MLEVALAAPYVPGTNIKGEVAGANWVFLLPSLEMTRILCLGVPSSAALRTLAKLAPVEVIVPGKEQRVDQELSNVTYTLVAGYVSVVLPERHADLLYLADASAVRLFCQNPQVQRHWLQALQPRGVVYLESTGIIDYLQCLAPLKSRFEARSVFWLTPLGGEAHTAVAAADSATREYFLRLSLHSPSVQPQMLRQVKRRLFPKQERGSTREAAVSAEPSLVQTERTARKVSGFLFQSADRIERSLLRQMPIVRRYGVLLGQPGTARKDEPPRFLQELARSAGIDISAYRWGFSGRGDYSSRKLLYYLFPPGQATPEFVVKMVRDSGFNRRLENEQQALSLLAERHLNDNDALPRVAFWGYHADLVLVAETYVPGVPFRQRHALAPDSPYVRGALDWLIDLGGQTAQPAATSAADALNQLLARYVEIYQPPASESEFLSQQIATIRQCQRDLPTVFQHGDPGIWNVLTRDDGGIAFLDWEAAEAQGLPLWDLFYFLRSYCAEVARAEQIYDRMDAFSAIFLGSSTLRPFIVDAVRRYLERVGLPAATVEPLFFTCWMHRALKEATLLDARKVDRGHYVNILRLCLEQRDAPLLRQLFSGL